MTDPVTRPDWLPKVRLLYGLKRFGISGAAAALEARLQEQGVSVHEETVTERAQRLKRASVFAAEAKEFRFSYDGIGLARSSFDSLIKGLSQLAEELTKSTEMRFIYRSLPWGNHLIMSPNAVLLINWHCKYANSLSESHLDVDFYDKIPRSVIAVPDFEDERKLASAKYDFKLVGPSRPAWVTGMTEIMPEDMADYLMKQLMHHNERELGRKSK